MAIARDYEEMLREDLADPAEAADYLSACLEEGDEVFLLGLRDVAKARGHELSEATEMHTSESVSKGDEPTLGKIAAMLRGLGLQLSFSPIDVSKASGVAAGH